MKIRDAYSAGAALKVWAKSRLCLLGCSMLRILTALARDSAKHLNARLLSRLG